jgi:hypothetical protein
VIAFIRPLTLYSGDSENRFQEYTKNSQGAGASQWGCAIVENSRATALTVIRTGRFWLACRTFVEYFRRGKVKWFRLGLKRGVEKWNLSM